MTVVLPQHTKLAASSTTAVSSSTSTPTTSTSINTKSAAIRPSATTTHCQVMMPSHDIDKIQPCCFIGVTLANFHKAINVFTIYLQT
ncbi:hypothetical protein CDAR_615021 [Caerostris darwini]|uniref:Uncharacterized protein n=1 Tax=Caerostris darwini TaxID=1538125 RepID=A0AAV4T0H7_9ARAC|nr:hypothetical protein CDAR_615021 [Caerostris darwini]